MGSPIIAEAACNCRVTRGRCGHGGTIPILLFLIGWDD